MTSELKRKDELIKSKNDALLSELAAKVSVKELNFGSIDTKNWAGGVSKSKTAFIALFR